MEQPVQPHLKLTDCGEAYETVNTEKEINSLLTSLLTQLLCFVIQLMSIFAFNSGNP